MIVMSQGHNRHNAALTLEKFIIRYWERVCGSDVCFEVGKVLSQMLFPDSYCGGGREVSVSGWTQ